MNSNSEHQIILNQYNKCLATIYSCKTISHCDVTKRMIQNLSRWWVSEEPLIKPFSFKYIAEPLERVLILEIELNKKRDTINKAENETK